MACAVNLYEKAKLVPGKDRRGVEAFAEALKIIPRTLAENSGLDSQESLLLLQGAYERDSSAYGLDLETG